MATKKRSGVTVYDLSEPDVDAREKKCDVLDGTPGEGIITVDLEGSAVQVAPYGSQLPGANYYNVG